MNGLFYVRPGSLFLQKINFKYFIYTVIISFVYVWDEHNTVWCSYTVDELIKALKAHSEKEILLALDALKDEGLISFLGEDTGTSIQVGTFSSGINYFSPASESGVDTSVSIVEEAIVSYAGSVPGSGIPGTLKEEFEEMIISINSADKKWFVKMWGLLNHAFLQVRGRPVMMKEHGQLNSLMKSYDNVTLFKIMVQYFSKGEKYGTYTHSLGHLCVIRDRVYADVAKSVKAKDSKNYMRKPTNERGSFI